jgi:hypothetical protein
MTAGKSGSVTGHSERRHLASRAQRMGPPDVTIRRVASPRTTPHLLQRRTDPMCHTLRSAGAEPTTPGWSEGVSDQKPFRGMSAASTMYVPPASKASVGLGQLRAERSTLGFGERDPSGGGGDEVKESGQLESDGEPCRPLCQRYRRGSCS